MKSCLAIASSGRGVNTMNILSTWQSALGNSGGQVWVGFLTILPTILGAIVIFAIGLLLAVWIRKLLVQLLDAVGLGKLSKSAGVDKFLAKAEIKMSLTEVIATAIEWLVVLVFFLAFVDILGLDSVSRVLAGVLGYVPNIVAAALIFGAGYYIADLVDTLVRGALASVDHKVAKPIGRLAHWVVLVTAFFAAIEQLRIAQGLVMTFFQGMTYTVVLVVGLSVGLGAKDLVSKVLTDWYDKIRK